MRSTGPNDDDEGEPFPSTPFGPIESPMASTATSRRSSRRAPMRRRFGRRRMTVGFTTLVAGLMILFGAVAPSAAHTVLEPTRETVVAVADGGVKDRGQTSDRGGAILGCSGHCAMHAWSLPAEPGVTLAASSAADTWPGYEIPGAVVRRPTSLERPPRF